MQVPFDFAQGRLSTPLKYASLRMTARMRYLANSLGIVGFGCASTIYTDG
jgi:hypothetical protein